MRTHIVIDDALMQGFRDDRGFDEAKRLLGQLEQVTIVGTDLAVEAPRNHRRLRAAGVTVRGMDDVMIATSHATEEIQGWQSTASCSIMKRQDSS